MVILRTRNKITDFLMISAWASPFNSFTCKLTIHKYIGSLKLVMFSVRMISAKLGMFKELMCKNIFYCYSNRGPLYLQHGFLNLENSNKALLCRNLFLF